MAAIKAAQRGAQVTLVEKNPIPGKKLLLSGKGRCNLTNTAELGGFIEQIPDSGKFLYNVFSQFFSDDLIGFLNKFGLKTKVENNGRVFPVTDNAGDVVDVFKAVQIHEHHRNLPRFAMGQLDRLAEPVLQQHAIR